MFFGIKSEGEQVVGDGIGTATGKSQEDTKKLAVNNKYGLIPDNNNKTSITVKQRPDKYADSKTKAGSSIIQYFTSMPESYTGWPLPVYGRVGDMYLLSDGYMLNIPRFDVISGYDSVISLTTGKAADDYFINMLKANGAPNTYKSSSGPAKDTLYGANRLHTGIDYATVGKEGVPIASPVSGNVVVSKYSSTAGNYAVIKDDGNTDGKQRYHRFMHMQNLPNVSVGDKVKSGQIIGYVGNTGSSSGAHLHYDIADDQGYLGGHSTSVSDINAHYLDPNTYLSKYFNKNGYPTTSTADAKTYTSSGTSSGNGGPSDENHIENIYKVVVQMLTYLSKISDNTSLIGEIVTLLTQLDGINDDKSLNNAEKQEKKSKIRQNLVNKTKEYARMLNSSNNESTGNKDLVKALQFIASQ